MSSSGPAKIAVGLSAALLLALACAPPAAQPTDGASATLAQSELDPPAIADSLAPNLGVVAGTVAATWLEPMMDGETVTGHRLRFARVMGDSWSAPVTISEGSSFFANWADLPGLVEFGDGTLVAHWLAKTADDTYAYSVFLARSDDGGATWTPMGKLNADETPTEHGFVSWVADGDGARAFWLDGRRMIDGGAMTLRTSHVGSEIGPEVVLDERTCECCSTDAAVGDSGPVVVYRDRSETEVRDVALVRGSRAGWGAPQIIHADEWRIDGCPVNGPEIAAAGDRVAVAWFTGAAGRPAVQLAFSDDGSGAFAEPVIIDAGTPLGRVDVALDEDGSAWVTWMRIVEEHAEVRLLAVHANGEKGEEMLIGETSAGRASGFPRLARVGQALYVAWVEIDNGTPRRLRIKRLSPI